jgi:plasmid maintenance system antidote protein VapI
MTDPAIHVGEFIRDELRARDWTPAQLAARMGGDSPPIDQLAIELLIMTPNPAMFMDNDLALRLEDALGVSEGFLRRLDLQCRRMVGWPETIEDAQAKLREQPLQGRAA